MASTSKKREPFYTLLATAYPLGYMPHAPGTWGSIPGLVLGWLIYLLSSSISSSLYSQWLMTSIILLILSFFAFLIIRATEVAWSSHDDKKIVIDEVIGQAIPVAFLPLNLLQVSVCFLLFRFFDILKPGPIGWADRRLGGALGTLLDDLIAGVFSLGIVLFDHHLTNLVF